uniref:Splicing factor U2af 38 kDa subunit n=1 Tax=Wuchereria bancrofti TaxID=6293 RepID=A0A1I8EKU3_WUCBA
MVKCVDKNTTIFVRMVTILSRLLKQYGQGGACPGMSEQSDIVIEGAFNGTISVVLTEIMANYHMSGAEYLASIYGTEKDKVNCSFYFKIGACRHGDKCSRTHIMPSFSQTVLLKNLYHNPMIDTRQADAFAKVGQMNEQEQQYFEEFFEEIFVELEDKFGPIDEMNVCDNIGEHMIGNVYVKFENEEDADKFNGSPVYAELSPVTDFREACCRQYELGGCNKGAFCNFMHLKQISRDLRRKLYGSRAEYRGGGYYGGGNWHEGRGGDFGSYSRRSGGYGGGGSRRRSRSPRSRHRY